MVKCCVVSLLFIGPILDSVEIHQLIKPNKKYYRRQNIRYETIIDPFISYGNRKYYSLIL